MLIKNAKSSLLLIIGVIIFGFSISNTRPLQVLAKQQSHIALTSHFALSQHCPPGFELVAENRCELRTLYQFYDSVQNRGVGGTHTSLPKHRDGFSPQQIDLGRYLFFDPALSGDETLSCASCHHPEKGFADGLPVSIGTNGALGSRSAPSLWNSAFLTRFFWDARSNSLEEQASGPLYSAHEMNNTPANLLITLQNNDVYQSMFQMAFNEPNSLSLANIYIALTAFQTSLISLNSRYDEYAHGRHEALSNDEIAGMNVFRSFVARCSECHTPPLFTNNQIAVIGTPEPIGHDFDIGAQATFKLPKLRGGFKVPSLRNIAQTAPYMHSGVFDNLSDATEFYNKGRGHAIPDDQILTIHWHISEPNLSDHEIALIVKFMHTLSDEKFKPETPKRVPSGLPIINNKKDSIATKPHNREFIGETNE